MQRLEVSGAVRALYGSLGVKGLSVLCLSCVALSTVYSEMFLVISFRNLLPKCDVVCFRKMNVPGVSATSPTAPSVG